MWKWIAVVGLVLWSAAASSHEDRIFPIAPGGEISGVPAPWGPVRVAVRYSGPGTVSAVLLSGRRFRTRLAPCVLEHLTHVVRVEASGSWWHDRSGMPAYMSLDFIQREPKSPTDIGESISVTVSLEDGALLMGQRTYDPWWGSPRAKPFWDAGKCVAWRSL